MRRAALNALRVCNFYKPPHRLSLSQLTLLRAMSSMASENSKNGRWWAPSEQTPAIKVYNSLSRSKNELKPITPGQISWYACGPTVYDDSHLGHARNYVTSDIIRRILKDYFGFKVYYVMNITDVDDKIILRGRQQHLLALYRSQNTSQPEKVRQMAVEALREYASKRLPLITEEVTAANAKQLADKYYGWLGQETGRPADIARGSDEEAKLKMHVQTIKRASDAILANPDHWDEVVFYEGVEDVLLPYLDARQGSQIDASDHSIFTTLTKKYEIHFMEDMRALNVVDPDALTRVTDYGDKIIDFVAQIEKNGYAYRTEDGSVYFDIDAFEKKGNQYAKLKPENRGNKALQADGEGALSKSTSSKRSDADFALWKSSKPGEPSWDSPWGKGRPGWHIECSAMATDKLGAQMDIHSGGIDLAFPHHDNEVAQSEAYLRCPDDDHQHTWVNNFLHMGHLSIQGAKMSKSLKNFTTIRDALSQHMWTSRSLRIVFLMGSWKDGIEVTDDVVQESKAWEERVNNFFLNGADLTQRTPEADAQHTGDEKLLAQLDTTKEKTQAALADSFDTSKVMLEISNLIGAYNTLDKSTLSARSVRPAVQWVTAIVSMFGLNGDATIANSGLGWSGVTIADDVRQYVYPLSEYRDMLRRKARSAEGINAEDMKTPQALAEFATASEQKANQYANVIARFAQDISEVAQADANLAKNKILALCDELRDVHLWKQDIYLEDRDAEQLPALVRPVTAQMRQERDQQGAEKARKEKEKAAAKAKKEAEEAAKLAKGKLDPREMFRTAEYSAWDDNGVPTKDAQGEEITKSRIKKLQKEWQAQKKLHEKWQALQN